MSKDCHWAIAALNYKNNDRITACPRGQTSLAQKSKDFLPSKIFNNEGFKDLRDALNKDIWHLHCKSCEDREVKNLPSYRQRQNEVFWHDQLKSKTDNTGLSSFDNLEYLEFRFSNTCNFSCLHCMPEYSSAWTDIVRKVDVNNDDIKNNITPLVAEVKNQTWTIEEAEAVADDLIANFPNVKRLDFAGGEPLYQKQFWAFLRKIVNHPNIDNMNVTVISNFNTPVDYAELAVLLEKFKESTIRISVDGGKGIYKYFRTGDWNILRENMQVFRSNNKKTILETTCTISAYQILDLNNTFRDMYFLPADRMHHTIVQYPTYLDPSVLKSRFLSKIKSDIQKIKDFLLKLNTKSAKVRTGWNIIIEIEELFDKTETNEEDYQRFLYYVERMDSIKNQNFDDHYSMTKADLKNAQPGQ
jgi:MoaA/NifB/PqqE/SkfB family radical SAM enzyme